MFKNSPVPHLSLNNITYKVNGALITDLHVVSNLTSAVSNISNKQSSWNLI